MSREKMFIGLEKCRQNHVTPALVLWRASLQNREWKIILPIYALDLENLGHRLLNKYTESQIILKNNFSSNQ